MYLPRSLISLLYQQLVRNHHPLFPPILILVALEPDALCACRILTALLKRDYIAHKIQPISGYGDLERAGQSMVHPMRIQNGGIGGLVVCLGVGGLVDLSTVLGLDADEEGVDPSGGVAVWLIDARRPWNLGNVFGGDPVKAINEVRVGLSDVVHGRIQATYRPGQGGVIVYDDGDIEEDLTKECEAYCELYNMRDVEDFGSESGDSGDESDIVDTIEGEAASKKRKSWSDRELENDESQDEDDRPRQRRRTDSVRELLSPLSKSHIDDLIRTNLSLRRPREVFMMISKMIKASQRFHSHLQLYYNQRQLKRTSDRQFIASAVGFVVNAGNVLRF